MHIVEIVGGVGVTALGVALLWYAARRTKRDVRSESIHIKPGPDRQDR